MARSPFPATLLLEPSPWRQDKTATFHAQHHRGEPPEKGSPRQWALEGPAGQDYTCGPGCSSRPGAELEQPRPFLWRWGPGNTLQITGVTLLYWEWITSKALGLAILLEGAALRCQFQAGQRTRADLVSRGPVLLGLKALYLATGSSTSARKPESDRVNSQGCCCVNTKFVSLLKFLSRKRRQKSGY